ncbi:hypothetical protein BD413DRAFT_479737 [Trametes elegans]|nr:hypothetical protein BD413DRAFT_479737 [Trametes elegans]
MEYYPWRPAEEWATGGGAAIKPMTDKQRGRLYMVAKKNGIFVAFLGIKDSNGQAVTKAEAYILINMIQDGVRPSKEFMNSLGRNPDAYTTPSHPRYWVRRDNPPTEMQRVWLNALIDRLRVPEAVKERGMAGLTLGQASLLIGRLREEEYSRPNGEPSMVFANALQEVRNELPA